MAVPDEDWKKFIDATADESDDVETDDESEDEIDEGNQGDDKDDSAKSKQDAGDGDDDSGEAGKTDDSEEDDADDKDDDKDDSKDDSGEDSYKPRLKQFLNSDGSLNAKKIETGYIESGKQAVELNTKLEESNKNYSDLLGAIAANQGAAELLFGKEGAQKFISQTKATAGGDTSKDAPATDLSQHPLIKHLTAQMTNASKSEYNTFVEAHPESVTDPEKARKIGVFLKQHGAIYREEHDGEIPGMKESLEAAYRYYGWDQELKDKQDVATAAKKAAATRTTPQGKAKATKKEISTGEQFFAGKLGVKLK